MRTKTNNEVLIQVGKNGFSDAQINEIIKNLNPEREIKVKFLKSFLGSNDKKQTIELIKEKLATQKNLEFKAIGNVVKIKKTSI